MGQYRGVRDGKPRAKGLKHMKGDDDVCGLDEIPRPEHVSYTFNIIYLLFTFSFYCLTYLSLFINRI